MLACPALPRLVVTIMTPFAAFEPYIAVADASRNTSIDWISSGATSASDAPGTPSIT
ncbi:hypothetical protein D3C87_1338600 [compost metagenome]